MKKLLLLMVVCLFAGTSAYATTVWDPAANGIVPPAVGNWNTAANWNNGIPVLVGDSLSYGTHTKAVLNNGAGTAECQVTDVQGCVNVVIGDGGPGGDVLRIMNGGDLTSTGWLAVGYSRNCQMIVETGGVANLDSHLWMAAVDAAATSCILDINGGTVNVVGNIGLGTIDAVNPSGGTAFINVNAGTLNLDHWSATGSIQNGSVLDIQLGAVTILGDQTGAVNGYVTAGKITAYGGTGTVVYDYNVTNTGKTTVTGQSGEKAAYPSPGNGTTDASVYSDLSWTAGIYATSHEVYFGTDSTPDATEFKGNQPETTFDPGILNLNTTYYWRIDEVDPCNPESPWTGDVWSFTTQTTSTFGKIVYPWNATTAIVKAGESFEVWFDADPGQIVNSVELHGPYNTVNPSMGTPVTGSWVYDTVSGNTYDTQVTVTVPSTAPADRYDLLLNTSYGQAISKRAVKVVKEYETDYTIMHISDSHLNGGTSAAPLLKISQIAKVANIIGPEMVFITGDDINWTSGDFQNRVDLFYDGYEPLDIKGMHGFDAASFAAVGNHDFTEGSGEAFDCCYESKSLFWNQYHGLQYHHFEYGNSRCMVVNTGWASYDYGYQLTDHISWLGAVGSGNFRMAAYHMAEGGIMGAFANNVNLGLAAIGHNHHLAGSNPYDLGGSPIQYFANSIREYLNFNLYRVNSDGSYTVVNNVEAVENRTADPSLWIPKLTLTYANANDGTSSTNTATLDNNFGVSFPRARVRFVMPKGGTYAVSQGTVEQQFDGDSVHVVDVRVAINADSTTLIEIIKNEVCGDINNDEIVNYEDLALFGSQWPDTGCGTCGGADFTGEGDVTIEDLAIMAQCWFADCTLIGYWKLDGDSADSSYYGFDGTLYGNPVWDPSGRVDGALELDGDGDYVEISGCKGVTGIASRTCAAWIKTTQSTTGEFITWGSVDFDGSKWSVGIKANVLSLRVKGGYIFGSTTINDGAWHHIAVTWQPDTDNMVSNAKLYVDDGVPETVGGLDDVAIGTAVSENVHIGDFRSSNYFQGQIDDVRIYDRALSESEIAEIAQ